LWNWLTDFGGFAKATTKLKNCGSDKMTLTIFPLYSYSEYRRTEGLTPKIP
jgi:hypothetical protein